MPGKPRMATSFKLPADAALLLDELRQALDLTKTQILGQAIREYARKKLPRAGGKNGRQS
jgi:predicted transcriptional regulator